MRIGKTHYQVFILLCIALSIAFNLTNAFGATINVPTVDYPTIQAGINAAVGGDTVLVADGTYTGDGNKNLDFNGKAITVISGNGPNNAIIDCEGEGRGFWFHTGEGENSVLSGFTITNGQADFGGGIVCFNSSPTITNCIIAENHVQSFTPFDGMGGGIYCEASSPIINNSIISKNSAAQFGGGIASQNGSSPSITDCSIIENRAFGQGMGVYSRESSLSFIRCTIQDNYSMSTAGDGGGIYCYNSNTIIDSCVIRSHRVGNGGGIHCNGGSLEITDSTISENEGTGIPNYGGGIHCSGANVNIFGCTISQNTAGGGGGIYCDNSTINISQCIITENRSTQFRSDGYGGGGGIFCPASTGSITNCLITENSAGHGGGISFDGDSPNITNCTISHNSASGDDSGSNDHSWGIYIRNSSPLITNCILWDNSPSEIFIDGGSPTITYSTVQNGWPGEANISDNPEFLDPSNGNYHLADYSPCIGTGKSDGAPVSDIEGRPRPSPPGSTPDMGAYENSRDTRDIPPLDIFGMYLGNVLTYQGTYPGGSYISQSEDILIDQTTFPTTTNVIEYSVGGTLMGRDWYETTSSELKLWGEDYGDFYKFSDGLVVAWYPMQVSNQRYSSATVLIEGLVFNVSMTANVLIKEPIDLGFDTLEAYKLRYTIRVWGNGVDISDTIYQWVLPYLGYVKTQEGESLEVLTDFAIGNGMITPATDADADGLMDYEELIKYQTNLKKSDTDDDGLNDGEEIHTYGTNPNDADSDHDGLNDGDEVNTYDTDPINEDTDNDGLTDGDEVNTYDTDPKDEDTDGDELSDGDEIAIGTNPNNPDTDGDTMPDGWEDRYGLDPLTDDANDDPDGDGLTNLQEYNLGRHPTNVEPDTPVLLLPDNNAIDILLTPELQTQSFSDTDGDNHAQSRWQISTVEGDFSEGLLVLNLISDSQLTSFRVPGFMLSINTTYYWRVKFYDDGGAASEWSASFSFKTIIADENDQNQNGVPDDQEIDDPNLDLDKNGTPDINQLDMKCVNTKAEAAQIGVKQGLNVSSIESLMWIDPATIDDMQNRPDNEPLGLISFKIVVDHVGDTAEVTVYLSEPAPAKAMWYRYDAINGWEDYSAHAVFSADRTSVTLELADGSFGDTDGAANTIIIDPSGLGVNASGGGGSGGGGGGCFISSAVSGFRMIHEIISWAIFFAFLIIIRPVKSRKS